jgi:hypothetical protein
MDVGGQPNNVLRHLKAVSNSIGIATGLPQCRSLDLTTLQASMAYYGDNCTGFVCPCVGPIGWQL